MNGSIPHQPLSTEIRPLTYTRDDLIAGCNFINIFPSPPNMSRIRRAMNIFNAGAVHLIQNGKGNHQIYAVQSESGSTHFYTVQGSNMSDLICECPDTHNGFECKHVFAVRYFNEQRREQAQIVEWEEYEANRGCAEDMVEGRRAAHLAESNATYQVAKARIDQERPISYNRPDSLTRRGDVLIARFHYNHSWKPNKAIADWREVILYLFPNAHIVKTTADRKNNVRCYFKL